MTSLRIEASRPYYCVIDNGISGNVGDYAITASVNATKACIVTDTNVAPLYAQRVIHSLESIKIEAIMVVLPAGEEAKSFDNYQLIISKLATCHFTKDDIIVSLGGGCVGDVATYVAATYMRGIHLIQVPTTLLAMVDSSIGGKCGINLAEGKNLVGTIYQPDYVLTDPLLLKSLPDEQFASGCAEMIKCGLISGQELFELVSTPFTNDSPGLVELISACVKVKAHVIALDEMDMNYRMVLNLGHTFGHAFEKISGYMILHGNAVACGTIMAAYVARYETDDFDEALIDDLRLTFAMFGLPVTIKDCVGREISVLELLDAVAMDKKFRNNQLNLVVPMSVGDVRVIPLTFYQLESFLRKILDSDAI